MRAKPKRPIIKTRREWCEPMDAWLVTCRVDGVLHNAQFSFEPGATARALAYEAAAEHIAQAQISLGGDPVLRPPLASPAE